MASPYYVAFDLDETLGYFGSPVMHLLFLDLVSLYQDTTVIKAPFEPSENLKEKLNAAFQAFAIRLASLEDGRICLRQGILDIVKRLVQLQDEGKVKKIVIYSNNGNIQCLKFAKIMIEFILGRNNIFCDLIHFYHPLRLQGNSPDLSNPGKASKTFPVFQKIFAETCGETDVESKILPQNSLFFDDTSHSKLLATLPPTNYFRVQPYKKDISFEVLNSVFDSVIKSFMLDTNEEYLQYAAPFIGKYKSEYTYSGLLRKIQRANRTYIPANKPFINDTAEILSRIDTIFTVPPLSIENSQQLPNVTNYGLNYFPVVDGGKRLRKRTKKYKTHKKKSKK
jgi:hypothetical protein